MRWMIADAEDPLDHLGDPLGGPDLPAIAKRLRASCQHLWQLSQLLGTQLCLRPRRGMTTQSLHSLSVLARLSHWLTAPLLTRHPPRQCPSASSLAVRVPRHVGGALLSNLLAVRFSSCLHSIMFSKLR